MKTTLGDFCPVNRWTGINNKGHLVDPDYIICDKTTGRHYAQESKGDINFYCFLLTIVTPIVHGGASVVALAYRIIKLITLSHFWISKEGEKTYDFNDRLKDAGFDVLRIIIQPIALIGLELAAIYGVFMPNDGRKLYASIERSQCDNCMIAQVFQPEEYGCGY